MITFDTVNQKIDTTNQKTKSMDVNYDMIEEVSWNANNDLFISLKNSGKKKQIKSIDASLQLLENIIKSYKEMDIQVDDYCARKNHLIK